MKRDDTNSNQQHKGTHPVRDQAVLGRKSVAPRWGWEARGLVARGQTSRQSSTARAQGWSRSNK